MNDPYDLDLPVIHAGKVRRLYDWPDIDGRATMLLVASDAISAYDYVLSTPIPDKGAVLTQVSLFWFDELRDVVANHVLSTDVPASVAKRAIVCERLAMVPIECVVRGYLTGSGWVEYQRARSVCGVALPAGLRDGDRLPAPIFTPAWKAPLGQHDENITYERMVEIVGAELGEKLRDTSLAIYAHAAEVAAARGIVLADTKFEFGQRPDGTLVLADEVLTPDSSRFWDAEAWARRGSSPIPSFDKQYVRDWLTHESGWDKESEPPTLPANVVAATRAKYVEAYERLTGRCWRG